MFSLGGGTIQCINTGTRTKFGLLANYVRAKVSPKAREGNPQRRTRDGKGHCLLVMVIDASSAA